MELPTWFELLAAVAPEVKPHQVYLNQVRAIAMGRFNEAESSD